MLAFIPIFAGSSKYQGWGGDYAGYLLQAKCISNGTALGNTNYIYNPGYAELAPPAYPVGFPLLLAPVYKIFGLDIMAFTRLMGLFWWLTGMGVFLLLKRYFSNWVSLVAALFFIYHPILFFERNGVLSDYPFAICILLSAYFYTVPDSERSLKNAVLVGLLAGFAWLIRSIGFVFPFIIGAHFLLERYYFGQGQASGPNKYRWHYPLIVLGTAFGIQLLFHGILFKLPETGSYLDQLNWANLKNSFTRNIISYTRDLVNYFQLNGDLQYIYRYKSTDLAVTLGGGIALGLSFWGMFSVSNKHERFFLVFMFGYMLVILFWPSFQGLRLLLPILPFLLYFLLKSIDAQTFETKWGNRLKWWLIPALLCGEYYRMNQHILIFSRVDEIGAPEWKDNQVAYRYVKDSVPAGAVFGHHHPLIFTLYADKPVMRWAKNGTPQEIQADFEKFGVDFLLLNDWLVANDEPLKAYLKESVNRLDTIWHNERNVLVKFK